MKAIKTRDQHSRENTNIVLIGLRGSGKTAVGEILGLKTGRQLVDTDAMIVERTGLTIPQIVGPEKNWERFRDLESEVAEEVGAKKGLIIVTGGGMILRATNVEVLKVNGWFAYLSAPPEVLDERIGVDPNRPALTGQPTQLEELRQLERVRDPLYMGVANVKFYTESFTAEQVANHVLHMYNLDPS